MNEHYLNIEFDPARTLQDQIREHLVALILTGCLPIDEPLPSSRRLADTLGVSRNTVVLIYEKLVEAGYLVSRERRGYFVASLYHEPDALRTDIEHASPAGGPLWSSRFLKKPSEERNIVKPNNWNSFDYPFIYGQIDPEFFPIEQWRECSRKTLSGPESKDWIHDRIDSDDPMLIEQLRTRLLPKRGIYAKPSEILITIGTTNALFMIANLLCNPSVKVGLEDPGYRDARNIFSQFDSQLHLQPVDEHGIIVDERLHDCDYIFLTPSHQVPTGAELSAQRRSALMEMAREQDIVLIEDDYDAEINTQAAPMPALKAHDPDNRVIYIGSLSKAISPGLRVGFMVADEELISEMRALRRLMYRHYPSNNQRQVALFLSLGHYDAYLRKIRTLYASKLRRMQRAIDRYLPDMYTVPISGGATAIWLQVPGAIDTEVLSWQAARRSILIEPGAIHFLGEDPPHNFLRLGFSAIAGHKIEPGIEALYHTIQQYRR